MISRVDSFPLIYKEPHYRGMERCITLVRVETRDGAVGWGEAISQFPEATVATKVLVDDGFAPLVLGEDPYDVEGLWRRMCEPGPYLGVIRRMHRQLAS
jgi:L-alanine-DL-glutamate epimerase-like enolase superfamily enzyme